MKRYLIIYIMFVMAALFTGCVNDTTDTPEMVEVGTLEVGVQIEGESVRTLNLSSLSHTVVVDVTLNNEGVYWQAVADQAWCQIVAEEHRGSGSFTIKIDSNDSFDNRETANIKFTAGEYEQHILTVNHYGNIFVIDRPYLATTKSAGSTSIVVKSKADVNWKIEGNEWLTATKGSESTDGDFIATNVEISWAENSDASRFGSLEFVVEETGSSDGKFSLWQYGSELNYDYEGHILLPAQEVAPLELRVPENTVKKLVLPNWVKSAEPSLNGDGTVSYMLEFTDNPSDAEFIRPSNISIEMVATGALDVQLPEIRQEYYPVGGLLTGAGMQLFAKRWNEGGDISNWCIDGVPTIVGDVDMSLVEEWIPIGTAERPFSGKFNGGDFKIQYFNTSAPLFGYCEGAEISNIKFDTTCEITQDASFSGTVILAPLATEVGQGSVVSNCTSYAKVAIEAVPSAAGYKAYLGGLVAVVGEGGKVADSYFYGSISTKEYTKVNITAVDSSKSYIGGVAATNSGTIERCTSEGTIDVGLYSYDIFIGSVVGMATSTTSAITDNYSVTTINNSLARSIAGINDITRKSYMGGIVGVADGSITGNENEGDIISTSNIKFVYAGGIVGLINKQNVVLQNNSVANRADIQCNGAARYAYLGGLVGYTNKDLTLDFTEDTGVISGYLQLTNNEAANTTKTALGGIIGHADGTDANITVKLIAPKWSGKILYNFENRNSTAVYNVAGGIVGAATACEIEIDGAVSQGDNINLKVVTNTNTIVGKVATGGIVGYAEAYQTRLPKVTIANSTNETPMSWNSYNKKSNGTPSYSGGILGAILDGEVTITNCHNKADIYNGHYNNNAYSTTATGLRTAMCATGGIVGSAGVGAESTSKVVISGCSNTANVEAYRAAVGGIAGYIVNATVSECSFTNGKIGDQVDTYAGGIVGVAEASDVENCTAKANVRGTSAGSCNARTGGIAGWAIGEVSITGCKYFGTLSIGTTTLTRPAEGEFTGGIAGVTTNNCTISNCKFGGKLVNELDESMNATITADNFADYVVGISSQTKATCATREISGCGYWDGASEE